MTARTSVVVIGAGLSGLATALRLAHSGWKVTVIERNSTPGGKMNRWESGGYVFDTGPSLITMPEVFAELFNCAGTNIHDHLELTYLDPVARYVFHDGSSFLSGQSLPRMQAELSREFPADQSGFFGLLALGGRLFELSRRTFFAQAPGEPPKPEMLPALRHMPLRYGWGNYHKTVQRFIKDPRLLRYFDRYATYVGSSPYQAPATLLAIPYLEHAHGAFHIKGGLYEMVIALANLLKQAGVDLRLKTHVSRIELAKGRICAVHTDKSERIETGVVVHNGDAAKLPGLLGQEQSSAVNRSLSGFVMLLGIRQKLERLQHHNVYFSNDYRREFDQLFGSSGQDPRFPDDPTVYVNIATSSDCSVAPPGCETLFIMANCPATDDWGDAETARARELVMRRLAASGFPDIQSAIDVEQIYSPREFSDLYHMPGGSIYGLASHGWRNTFLRPANRARRIKGLYRVGGSSHPGGGTPTVLIGSKIVEELINQYESP